MSVGAPAPVRVSTRFTRSTSLELDYGKKELLDGYIVSPLAAKTLGRIVRDLSTEGGNRAWSLVGPYGCGKSSFLTFLAAYVSGGELRQTAATLLATQQREDSNGALQDWARLPGQAMVRRLVPITITGTRSPLGPTVLRGILRTAEGLDPHGAYPDLFRRITNALSGSAALVDTRDVVDMLAEFSVWIKDTVPGALGVFLLIDELGKLLEYAAQNPSSSDIYLLQQIAELAGRTPDAGLSILTVLHQEFEEYAGGLPAVAQAEWTKVQGRFETVTFLESTGHLLKLMARAIEQQAGLLQTSLFRGGRVAKERAIQANELSRSKDSQRLEDLIACFPLNPVVALCVAPLFRMRMGQNERSLFSFLSSGEPGGFQSYLIRHQGKELERPYGLDDLYDYVIESSGGRVGNGARARVWAATEEAIHRLPKDAEALDIRILKALAILNSTGDSVGLNADKKTLALALTVDAETLGRRVDRLKDSSILVYRRFKSGYQTWDGSDLDVDSLLEASAEHVRKVGGLADAVQRLLPPLPVVASRHYHQTGTLRSLRAQYVRPEHCTAPLPGDFTGDGLLRLLIPDRAEQVAELETTLLKGRGKGGRPVVVALPGSVRGLLDGAIDLLAADHALANTAALDGDPVARRELETRRSAAMDALTVLLSRAFGSAREHSEVRWIYGGAEHAVGGRPSAAASSIFDQVYSKCPHILNELVNREELSSAAAAARTQLMKRLLSDIDKENLGISGHPPELSMYRSVLESTGLHQKQDGRWALQAPKDKLLAGLFNHLEEQVQRIPGRQVPVTELVLGLGEPPFGMRSGLALLLLFVWVLQNQQRLFLYEDGGLLPELSEDFIERLVRPASNVTIQLPAGGAVTEQAVSLLASGLFPQRSGPAALFDVVRGLLGVVRRLSPYAAQTQELSPAARRVRTAIRAAKDPVRLLLTELPTVLDQEPLDSAEANPETFARSLLSALAELQRADQVLLNEIEQVMRDLLQGPGEPQSFYAELGRRAQAIAHSRELPPQVRRWVELSSSLGSGYSQDRDLWLKGVAVIALGKQPEQWRDEDRRSFAHNAMELCRAYLAAEDLALARGHMKAQSFRMVRVSILDSEGQSQSGVTTLRPEDQARVSRFSAEVRALAQRHGLNNKELAWAAIVDMLALAQGAEGETGSDV